MSVCNQFALDASQYLDPSYIKDQQARAKAEADLKAGTGLTLEFQTRDTGAINQPVNGGFVHDGLHVERDTVGILLAVDTRHSQSIVTYNDLVYPRISHETYVYSYSNGLDVANIAYSLPEEDRLTWRFPLLAGANSPLLQDRAPKPWLQKPFLVPPCHKLLVEYTRSNTFWWYQVLERWLLVKGIGWYWSKSNATWVMGVLRSILGPLLYLQ